MDLANMIGFNTTLTDAAWVQTMLGIVGTFFVVYLIGYSSFLFLSVTVGSSILYRRKREAHYKSQIAVDCYTPISIIVPAHNEEVTIVDSVTSLTHLDYSLFEIIVVDDGSTDRTVNAVLDAFDLAPTDQPIHYQVSCNRADHVWAGHAGNVPITLITKPNGGKSDALNMGINASRYPYFICIDADSMLQHDALWEISSPLIEDDDVVAVGGLVRPSNGVEFRGGVTPVCSLPKKTIPAMQALEYDRSFLSARILFDQFNGNLIISGAFGLFRKDMVIATGGYDRATVGEDMELVTKLHVFCRSNGIPYRIRYAPDAVCWSQAPETLRDLMKQRKRWHRGLAECMVKHWHLFASPRYGLVSTASYTYFLIYELLSPLIELFGLITLLIAYLYHFVNAPFMVGFFLIYALFGSTMSLTAFFSRVQTKDLTITWQDAARAVILSLFEITVLRFALALARMSAIFGRRHAGLHWETVTRTKIDVR